MFCAFVCGNALLFACFIVEDIKNLVGIEDFIGKFLLFCVFFFHEIIVCFGWFEEV